MSSSKQYDNINRSRHEIFVNNFIGGIAWALGATIGVSVLLGIIAIIAKQINFIPIIGTFVAQIADYVSKNALHR